MLAADINPASLALAAINAASDLLTGVDGEFDLIVSNPTFMLDPSKCAYRSSGACAVPNCPSTSSRRRWSACLGGSLLLYTGVAISADQDDFLGAIAPLLDASSQAWTYEELHPDVFGEDLSTSTYDDVERIAAVWLHALKRTRTRKSDH